LGQQLAPQAVQAPLLQRRVPVAPSFTWSALPPQTLAQRPDLAAAHQQWLAAAYSEQGVRAEAWPQLSLSGLIGNARLGWGSGSTSGAAWSIGPSLSLPLFDGGLRQGQRDAAKARTAQAAAAFESKWRAAVLEVEEALQLVASAAERLREADTSQREWERIAADATRLAQAGVQSGPQRASTLRNALSAYGAAVAIRHEHAQAWVRLYRVLGGGFEAATSPANGSDVTAKN
jgi:outer membrane protein TolC